MRFFLTINAMLLTGLCTIGAICYFMGTGHPVLGVLSGFVGINIVIFTMFKFG